MTSSKVFSKSGHDISRLLPLPVVSSQVPPDEIWFVAPDETGELCVWKIINIGPEEHETPE